MPIYFNGNIVDINIFKKPHFGHEAWHIKKLLRYTN